MSALKYVQTPTFYQAGSGNIIGATSIVLTSFQDIYGNVLTMSDFGGEGYGTCESDTTNEEAFTFTGVTANANGTYSLTGVKTALAKSPYTETSGLVRQHAGGTKVVITDNVAFWNTFANKNNDETIGGQWTFTNTPIVPGTVSNASTTVKGVSKLNIAPEDATNPVAVGANVLVAYAIDSVGTDAYAITPTFPILSYQAGQTFTFKAGTANTGAATLNVSGLGAKTIKRQGTTTDLSTGDILINQIVVCVYDGTNMQMLAPNTVSLTTQVSGVLPVANGGTGLVTKNYNSGVVAGPNSNTTQNIAHGLGKTPAHIKITAFCSSTGVPEGAGSVGTYDGTSYGVLYYAPSGTNTIANIATNAIVFVSLAGGSVTDTVSAMDATNITLSCVVASGGAGNYLLWEAWGI